jgi:integrase
MNLTKSDIDALEYEGDGHSRDIRWDEQISGFGVRIYPSGRKAFVLSYRFHGTKRLMTVGKVGVMSLDLARKKARRLLVEVDDNVDPLKGKRDAAGVGKVKALCDDYIKKYASGKRSGAKDEARINRYILPAWGQLKAADVTTSDVEDLHRKIGKKTPYEANRLLALVSTMFSLARKWHYIPKKQLAGWVNPAADVKRYPEEGRERYLTTPELKRLVAALDAFPDRNIASAVALMMLTGCRKTEALTATWDQFDLDAGVWTKPSHHTKQKRTHRVPLNAAAVELLNSLPRTKGNPHVFPGRAENQPLKDIKKAWEKLRQAAELPDLRMHDLRHSYASLLASQNLSLPIIGQLLGHTQAQTTKRYAHLLDESLKEATDKVGVLIQGARS